MKAMHNKEIANATLDRILAGEEELLPSSGFAERVMLQVREEAMAPAEIPFPWRRVLPGIILLVTAIVGFSVAMARPLMELVTQLGTMTPRADAAGGFEIGMKLTGCAPLLWLAGVLLLSGLLSSYARRIA